jgi:hypothetical protein
MRTYTVIPQGAPKVQNTGKEIDGRPEKQLLENFWVRIDNLLLTIPAKFLYDDASVPCGLWNAFPPDDPHYDAAAAVHDWLCATELLPRREADDIFLFCMRYEQNPPIKRALMWMAVRLGGKLGRADSLQSILSWRSMIGITDPTRPLWQNLEQALSFASRNRNPYIQRMV